MSEPELITRALAKRYGLKSFYTGQPCTQGHVARRNVKNGQCHKCLSLKAQRRYRDNAETQDTSQ